jgi:hypothetical protein
MTKPCKYWRKTAYSCHDGTVFVSIFTPAAYQRLNTNVLLGKSFSDVSKLLPQFNLYQSYLRSEFRDAATRFERLSEVVDIRLKKLEEQEAVLEAERREQERNGLAFGRRVMDKPGKTKIMSVAKEALKLKKSLEKQNREQAEKEAKELMEKERLMLDESEIPAEMKDPGFEVTDLIVYMRYLIAEAKGTRDMRIFTRRATIMPHMDRVQLLKDYRLVSKVQPGKNMLEIVDDLDGINLYVPTCIDYKASND